jgi:hypothetical protein
VKDTETARSVWLSTTAKIKNILFLIVKELKTNHPIKNNLIFRYSKIKYSRETEDYNEL